MSEETIQPKPRLWLRVLLVLVLILAIVGTLAFVKKGQIDELTAQASQTPPPISVTVANTESAQWRRKIKAIGTLIAFQEVDVTTEVSGVSEAMVSTTPSSPASLSDERSPLITS